MSVFLVIMTQQYLAELKFKKETEAIRLQEYYMLSSLKLAEQRMLENSLTTNDSIEFDKGKVEFSRVALSDLLEDITFTLSLDNGREITGTGTYDKEQGRMVKWRERN